MTPRMPLSGRGLSHLPSTSEESGGSIAGKNGNFRGRGVRGDAGFLQWLLFAPLWGDINIPVVIWGRQVAPGNCLAFDPYANNVLLVRKSEGC